MCPLRLILIFLSATLAGFFILKNLNSQPQLIEDYSADEPDSSEKNSNKEGGAVGRVLWVCVDVASGRYLWRNLVSKSSSS